MASIVLILVEAISLVIASPVPQDLFFADSLQDSGASLYPDSVFDPLYWSTATDSNRDPSNPDGFLYMEMTPGEMATSDQATLWKQPDLFNPENLLANSNIVGQINQPNTAEIPDLDAAENDCLSDVSQVIGIIRLRRSCPDLKQNKPQKNICTKNRAQLACCTEIGIEGVYNYGCTPCMHSPCSA